MTSDFRLFLENFKRYYSEKKTVRWLLFTYPKSCATISLLSISYLVYFTNELSKEAILKNIATTDALHTNDNVTRKNRTMLIYGKNQDSK